jgi:hypothetical protein
MTFGVYSDPAGINLIEQYDFIVEYNKDALSLTTLAVHGFSPGSSNPQKFFKTKDAITQGT